MAPATSAKPVFNSDITPPSPVKAVVKALLASVTVVILAYIELKSSPVVFSTVSTTVCQDLKASVAPEVKLFTALVTVSMLVDIMPVLEAQASFIISVLSFVAIPYKSV
jgi:hypothetical protein